jgi:hypothetical protein
MKMEELLKDFFKLRIELFKVKEKYIATERNRVDNRIQYYRNIATLNLCFGRRTGSTYWVNDFLKRNNYLQKKTLVLFNYDSNIYNFKQEYGIKGFDYTTFFNVNYIHNMETTTLNDFDYIVLENYTVKFDMDLLKNINYPKLIIKM